MSFFKPFNSLFEINIHALKKKKKKFNNIGTMNTNDLRDTNPFDFSKNIFYDSLKLEKKKEKGFSDYHNKDILATRNSLADIIELQGKNFDNQDYLFREQ